MRRALALLGLIAAPALAATSPEQRFTALTDGRTAGKSVDCILPEFAVQPEILDRRAIAYRAGSILYVNRFTGTCRSIRWDSQIRTVSIAGRLCRNDHFRIFVAGGGPSGELCAFGPFTPYTKAR